MAKTEPTPTDVSLRGMNFAPWAQVLADVPHLNSAAAPFSYAAENGTLVGFWDIAKIRMLNLAGLHTLDQSYKIVFRPVDDGVFDWVEHHTKSEGTLRPTGGSFSKQGFVGKSIRVEKGIVFGAGTSHGEPTTAASYSFDTRAIKDPAMGYLGHYGWTMKKGFLNRIFG